MNFNSLRNFLARLMAVVALTSVLFAGVPCQPVMAASPKKTQSSKNTKNTQITKSSKSTRRTGKNTASQGPRTSAEAKRLQEATQKEISRTKQQIRLNDREIKEGLADLNQLSAEINTGKAKVVSLNNKVASLQGQITELNSNIAKNESELQRMREEYLKAVKKMRLNRKNQSMLAFIFASKDFNQAMRRMRYIRQFSKWKETKSGEITGKIEQLGREKELLAAAREQHAVSLSQLTASQKELEAKHSRQQRLVEGLRQNGTALQKHLSQKQNEANRLRESIATLIAQEQARAEAERIAREKAEQAAREKAAREKAEADRIAHEKEEAARRLREASGPKEKTDRKKDKKKEDKAKDRTSRNGKKDKNTKNEEKKQPAQKKVESPNTSGGTSQSCANTSGFASLRGKLPRPVEGAWRITNPFGRHAMPELPDVVYDNPGIDAEVSKGASVKAVAGGKVSGIYKVQGYGTVVIVNHGEYYTVYGNLSSVAVSVGSQIKGGSTVGSAAADPDDQRRGSVHFELWKGREKQNPESWLR